MMTRKLLLVCGILSSVLYVAMNIIAPMKFPGYSVTSQTVSELSAIDAPSRPIWILMACFYSVLVIGFGLGVWQSAIASRPLKVVSILLVIYGITGFFWPPMHQREVLAAGGATLTDTLHIAFTFASVTLMMLIIGFGAAALDKRFRYYSIATILALFGLGIFTGNQASHIEANLPTPMIGIWERIDIGVYVLWVIVFSVVLLKRAKRQGNLGKIQQPLK